MYPLTLCVPPPPIHTCQLCNGSDLHGGGQRCFVTWNLASEEETKGGGVVKARYKELWLAVPPNLLEKPTNTRRNHEEHTAEDAGCPDVGAD